MCAVQEGSDEGTRPGRRTTNDGNDGNARDVNKPVNLDDVLRNELGQFGWFQIRNILLVVVPIIMSAFVSEYIFSAAAIPHRCQIPECGENRKLLEFDREWLLNAIPESGSSYAGCERYQPNNLVTNGTLNYCPATLFDQSRTVACEGFVYAKDNTVVYDFDLGCQEWLRALAGTMNSLGTLLVLPIIGYISDRFGRRFALIISVINLGAFGLIRAFSVNYTMYLVLQIVQTTLGAGTYSTAYVFATELVGPKYRVFTSATCSSMFGVGQVVLGSVAWLISPWRYMLMALHIPCFFIVVYYWMLTESVRWLLSKNKCTEAEKILRTVARINKTDISEKSLNTLLNTSKLSVTAPNSTGPGLMRTIRRSPVLLRRVFTIPIWWITVVLIYYGLSINSAGISETVHLNYILTSAVGVPGFYAAVLVLDTFGRKPTLCVCLFFCAACNIAFVFIPNDLTVLRLIVFLMGKCSISTASTSVYLYTIELYPTEFRHTLLAFSSMIGRIGSVTAPLTPVLMDYWHGIPSMLFAGMGILSGLLVLTQPETLGTKLPDTLAEAEAIGRESTKV